MDKQVRSRLQKLVSNCRSILDKEFTAQLQMIYGMQPTGRIDELSTLTHLDNEQYRIATLLRDRVNHLSGLLSSSKEASREAVQRLIREQAFTVLNRFAALKMCEERQITQECVKSGYQSKGFQLFLATCGSGIGDSYQRYVVFIKSIFDELSLDLGVLFDRFSPFSLLFPRENAMGKLFTELNTPELSDIWKEDEAIGWVYQYFNSKEERQAMRKSSSAPRNSRELAVRNQFFTPRYVVQFLTDNTLGRIWYEMTGGDTELKGQCEYLVRRPQEVFLAEGENPPDMPEEEGDKSQEELLKEPEYISHRKIKDPRKIRMLDPACGSMHFGLYAFDLYETIYEEAWERYPELLQDIRKRVKEKQEFLAIVPELIIRHNIHGIDIDHRAVQIAGLSLWLRAQKSYQRLEIQPEERPRITRSNVVCAEPMPGEKDYLEEFISGLKPAVLGDLVKDVWEKMQLAGEAGSLLKIEEELTDSIRKAREVWEKYKFEKGAYAEQDLFEKRKQLSLKEMIRFDIGDVESTEEWDQMEGMVLSALREFAESASGNGGYNRKLFAEDAAQGFAFIDVCRKRYDVVLMNPPFGEFVKAYKAQARNNYPNSYNDIFAAFAERWYWRLAEAGALGAITSRVGFFLTTLKRWRSDFLLRHRCLSVLVDLGEAVMDEALVESAAYILSRSITSKETVVVRLLGQNERGKKLLASLEQVSKGYRPESVFIVDVNGCTNLPDAPIVYWVEPGVVQSLSSRPRFEPVVAQVRQGLVTGDNPRFARGIWEVPSSELNTRGQFGTGSTFRWAPLVMKGPSQPWYSPITVVVNWRNNGQEIKNFVDSNGKVKSRPQNTQFYFRPGFSWTLRAVRFIPYTIPVGCIPTASRYMAFPKKDFEFACLGVTAANLSSAFFRFYGEWFCRPKFLVENVKALPWPELPKTVATQLKELISEEVAERRMSYQLHEPFHDFVAPGIVFQKKNANPITCDLSTFIGEKLEEEVADAYGFNAEQLQSITRDLREAIIFKTVVSVNDELDVDNSEDDKDEGDFVIEDSDRTRYEELVAYSVGTTFGRWDIRIGLDPSLAPQLAGPFDPLPVCPPGMLVGPDGLPAESGGIVSEEWLRARPNAINLPPEGSVKNSTIPDSEYPVEVAWNGILVDDASHRDDIIGRMRQCFQVTWQEKADSIEQEACEILDVKDLRDYFRRPSGFFADHLKRYSKSRRQAPIYWPLSTASGSYTLWIYYPRLTDQTLYRCVNDYINPKLEHIAREIELQQREVEKSEAVKARQELEDLLNMQQEIRELKDELLRVAELPYKPNLNDGVLITASPIYKLFRLAKWRKDLGKCWESLEKGDYDWAHLAYSIWPDRVKEKCRKDRSLAIAHDLEDTCEVAPKAAKKKAKSNTTEGKQIDLM